MMDMNKLSLERRAQIISCLVEGNSVRATCRMTGSSKGAVLKLIADLGPECAKYQDEHLRNLPCKRLQADEVWSFCYSKQKNIPEQMIGKVGVGDVWTWTAIDADTKLIPCWYVGSRSGASAYRFMTDLAGRLANRVQLTTDGLHAYLSAVDAAFDRDIDYAMLVKIYGDAPESEKRYSPADCLGADKTVIRGRPDPAHISTSYVERQNLTMRMSMRRFTRLTNGFSKKLDNHKHMLAIYFMYYNFGRVHQTIRVTPAMEAGVSDHIWTSQEICNLDSK
jgi:IS1 family transposase